MILLSFGSFFLSGNLLMLHVWPLLLLQCERTVALNLRPMQLQKQKQQQDPFPLLLKDVNNEKLGQGSPFHSRRRLFQSIILTTITTTAATASVGTIVSAAAAAEELDPRAIVTVRIEFPNQELGLQLGNMNLRGKPIVFIQQMKAGSNTKLTKQLEPGMILLNYESAKDVVQRMQNGPYPIELKFFNLAAGGDAFNDLGQTMVTAQDALNLAKQTDNADEGDSKSIRQAGGVQVLQQPNTNNLREEYSVTTIDDSGSSLCAIQSRRGDLLEIEYEAAALISESASSSPPSSRPRRVVYDASFMRGTGLPYQTVLGSGDMIPGVDLGLYDMCPGQERLLKIPPKLAYGPRGNKLYKIPPETPLEWKVKLISIDATIRQDNNDQTREEREGRALY